MSWIDEFVELLFPIDAKNLKIEPAYMLKQQNLPRSVFKYRGVNEYSLANLRDNQVWLADPKTFNDPYDCSVFVDLDAMADASFKSPPNELLQLMRTRFPPEIVDTFQAAVTGSDNPFEALVNAVATELPADQRPGIATALKEAFSQVNRQYAVRNSDRFKEAFKVCSFSERVDSTLMWAHYANYHKGFCVEYSMEGFTPSDPLTRFMYPVIYAEHPFNATESIQTVGTASHNNLYLNKAGLIKSTDWAYEKEWRLIISNGLLKSAQSFGMPTPKCVYLGSHITPEDQQKILEICHSKGVPVRKMKHSPGVFAMQAAEVENVAL
ncbi:DUF2971 domain-containing protein [Paraburkholderia sp. SIMBA_027]|uniref:DUF2971 domain-containing protein n=1 Tax=Paraburkholderia sp. SIMBA_027 TaxID=3085770 RepID=UPI003979B98B